MPEPTVTMGFMNLHDAFLNASLQYSLMLRCPVPRNPREFYSSDRGRLERSWVCFLYVLVEAWNAGSSRGVRTYAGTLTSTVGLVEVLRSIRRSGHLRRMEETRNYMCHRDRREYWDAGRTAAIGAAEENLRVYRAFSDMFLAAFRAMPRTPRRA